MTCEMKNLCAVARGFQSCCMGCLSFIINQLERNQNSSTSKKKKNHNEQDSAEAEEFSGSFSSFSPFPLSLSGLIDSEV